MKKTIFCFAIGLCLLSHLQAASQYEPIRPFIFGGEEVSAEDQITKFTVSLIRDGKFFCTGTIIDKDIVLTAKHCFKKNGKEYYVNFGIDTKRPEFTRKIIAIESRKQQDIAVVRFAGDLPQSFYPVSFINQNYTFYQNELITVVEFGINTYDINAGYAGINNDKAFVLRQTKLELVYYNDEETGLFQKSDKGTCMGDSGSESFINKDNKYYIIGVLSTIFPSNSMKDCRGTSSYVNVNYNMKWIAEAIGKLHKN